MPKQKNYSIELLRFLFMVLICLHHHNMNRLTAGHLSVEFYFVLSGWFIYLSARKSQSATPAQYWWQRVKRFLPEILIMLPFAVWAFCSDCTWKEIAIYATRDITMTGGIFGVCLNYPMWYVSILLWCGTLLYALIRYLPRTTLYLLVPLIAIPFYGYVYSQETFALFDNGMALIRGFASMGLGALLCHVFRGKHLPYGTSLACISLLLMLAIATCWKVNEVYVIPCIPLFLVTAFDEQSWFHKVTSQKIWSRLGSITFEMLVVHAPIVHVFHVLTEDVHGYSALRCLVLLAIIIIAAFWLRCINDKIKGKFIVVKNITDRLSDKEECDQ